MTIAQALAVAARQGLARLDAQLLLLHALGRPSGRTRQQQARFEPRLLDACFGQKPGGAFEPSLDPLGPRHSSSASRSAWSLAISASMISSSSPSITRSIL